MLDFINWPAFREFAVQLPAMQERMEWMMDMSICIECDWSFPNNDAFQKDEETGMLDLCPVAMVRVHLEIENSGMAAVTNSVRKPFMTYQAGRSDHLSGRM